MAISGRDRILDVMVGIGLAAAVFMAADRYFARSPTSAQAPAAGARSIPGWRTFQTGGHDLAGSSDSPVTMVVFSDFQCPACLNMTNSIRELTSRYADTLRVVFRHFPLDRLHAHARGAAMAAECAGAVGRFAAYHDALFASQSLLGSKSWTAFAVDAGLADTAAFSRCVADSSFASVVGGDVAEGARLQVHGTPSALINEWFVVGSGKDRLFELVEQEVAKVR